MSGHGDRATLAAHGTLRQLREQCGWTMDEIVKRLEAHGGKWSTSKISRIENRQQGVKSFDVERMLDAYEVTDANTCEWVFGLSARGGAGRGG